MSTRVIDMHAHTIHSDGSATPLELVTAAAANGASAVAITDHDTVAGLPEGREAAAKLGVEFINGIEISAEYSPGTMHILGYYINDRDPELLRRLEDLRYSREQRNPRIAERLKELGFDISYEEVAELAGNEVVGRPHFARVMVQKGFVAGMQDAFDRFLGKGAAAYVEKARLSPAESIELIHDAGGAAVLAHPYQLKLSSLHEVDRVVEELAQLGLDGIEAIYSRHSLEQRDQYSQLAARHALFVTGGSDYHGSYKPDIEIVRGLGDLEVPYALLDEIKARTRHHAQ
jgi:predicted metal-dependent phosphoesterase TrpH